MAFVEFTAEVVSGLTLQLPQEAEELQLKPGEKVRVKMVEVPGHSNKRSTPLPIKRRVSAMGKYAGLGWSSDEYNRRKQEEIEFEERRLK